MLFNYNFQVLGLIIFASKCANDFYYHQSHKQCFPCSNICATTILFVSDECNESCPGWTPKLIPKSTAGHSTIIIVIVAVVVLIVLVLFGALLFKYRHWKRKHKKPLANEHTTEAVQETSQYPDQQLLTASVDISTLQDETFVKMEEGLENINFSFSDSLIDSTCHMSGTQLSPSAMEQMYEEGSPDIINDKDLVKSMLTYFSDNDNTFNLDSALENVVDLQEFINTSVFVLNEDAPNNDDNFPVSDIERRDCHIPTGYIQASSVANYIDISKYMPEVIQQVCMPHSIDNLYQNKVREEPQILANKPENLELAAWEKSKPGGRSRLDTSSGDSYSSFSTQSSRSNSPNSHSTVAYECRKPGRKPSSNGPIRPRKREPPKNTPEYFDKRARNNVAVRKSREKAKSKQDETDKRVSDLQSENESLQKQVDLLSKELHVLKSLFLNVGTSLHENFEDILGR